MDNIDTNNNSKDGIKNEKPNENQKDVTKERIWELFYKKLQEIKSSDSI